MAMIHPSATVDPSARLSDEIEIGAFAVVEGNAEIGPGTVLRPHSIVRENTILGANNYLDSFTVLGGEPQDRKFDRRHMTRLRIGNDNVFREGVTISRATGKGTETVVGNGTYWMANSHAGHNCVIHDHVIVVNGALIAGHCTIGSRAILPANGAIHQYCWIGERVMFQGGAKVSKHVPPFLLCARDNCVIGLNAVGLRRSEDIRREDRRQIREAFRITYQSGLPLREALARMESFDDWGRAASNFRDFLRKILAAESPFNRGLCPSRKSHLPESNGPEP